VRRSNFTPLLTLLLITACGSASNPGVPSDKGSVTSPPPLVADVSPGPFASGQVSFPPTATTGAASPDPTRRPTSRPIPSISPPVGLSDEERGLVLTLREDAQVSCRPRRSNLPIGATAAVECLLGTALVNRVSVYGFGYDPRTAALAYLERMDHETVLGSAGDCLAGTPQDFAWSGQDGVEDANDWQVTYEARIYSASRFGCFLSETGSANFVATCGEGTYIGVVGQTAALDALSAWALRPPPGEEVSGPGICFGTLGGGLDSPDTVPDETMDPAATFAY